MSRTDSPAAAPVLGYATTPDISRERLLRAAAGLGFLAWSMTALFLPVWRPELFGRRHVWMPRDYERWTQTFVPWLQALCIGAGLTLTRKGRPIQDEGPRGLLYPVALATNLLVIAALLCEAPGAGSSGGHVSHFIPLTSI